MLGGHVGVVGIVNQLSNGTKRPRVTGAVAVQVVGIKLKVKNTNNDYYFSFLFVVFRNEGRAATQTVTYYIHY